MQPELIGQQVWPHLVSHIMNLCLAHQFALWSSAAIRSQPGLKALSYLAGRFIDPEPV